MTRRDADLGGIRHTMANPAPQLVGDLAALAAVEGARQRRRRRWQLLMGVLWLAWLAALVLLPVGHTAGWWSR